MQKTMSGERKPKFDDPEMEHYGPTKGSRKDPNSLKWLLLADFPFYSEFHPKIKPQYLP